MKFKLSDAAIYCAVFLMVFMMMFSGAISARLPASVKIVLLLATTVFAILSNCIWGKFKFINYIPKHYACWLLFCVFVFMGLHTNISGSLRILCSLAAAYLLQRNIGVIKASQKALLGLGFLFVFFTFFFYVFPGTYKYVISFYKFVPAGTSNGTAGYRAGITNNFSQNGIYISVFLMTICSKYFSFAAFKKNEKRSKMELFLIAAALVALLLTAKRGVLIYSVSSIFGAYLITSKRKLSFLAKFGMAAMVIIVIISLLSEFMPEMGYIFERLARSGEDTSSLERFAMWKLALKYFSKKPLFGVGFWRFRDLYRQNLFGVYYKNSRYQRLDAHNTYIQVLCETGIIGAIFYVTALLLLLGCTIQLARRLRNTSNDDLRFGVTLSLCIQLFYMVYSLTGNCLHDVVFYLYAIAMTIVNAILYYLKCENQSTEIRKI